MTTIQQTESRYFDNSMSALAYINRLEKREGENGSWYTARIAVMTGERDAKPVVVENYQTTVVGNVAKIIAEEIIEKHGSDGIWQSNAGNETITAAVRVGNLKAKHFVNNENAVIPYIEGRIVSLKSVRINGAEISLPQKGDSANQPPADKKENEKDSPEDEVTRFVVEATQNKQAELKKEDPLFKEKKKALKDEGFSWDAKKRAWVYPDDGIPF